MKIYRSMTATRTRRLVLVACLVTAIPAIALAWWLGSPLFLDKTVDEEFPRTVSAAIPESMTRAEAEQVMVDAASSDETTAEEMTTEMLEVTTIALKSGSLRDEDRIHKGAGTATIYRVGDGTNVLRLEELDVTNGPDLFVLLMQDPEGRDKDQGYVELGRLKGNRGNQNYDIPDDVNIEEYRAVMIYCRAFHVVFSTAPLEEVGI